MTAACSPEGALRLAQKKAGRIWVRCPGCRAVVERERLRRSLGVCEHCGRHHPLTPRQRIGFLFDPGSFRQEKTELRSADPLRFEDGAYSRALASLGGEAMLYGVGSVLGSACVAVLMDFGVFGGSMGVVAGEVFSRACRLCVEKSLPLLAVTASGGARMQEGTPALLQMAKTMAALKELEERGIGYVSLLCDPTCGGVTASFATAADVILAEPGALVCFSGPRVVEQTTGIKSPPGFSRAEEHWRRGMLDEVVPRERQPEVLGGLLRFLAPRGAERRGEAAVRADAVAGRSPNEKAAGRRRMAEE